VDALNLNHSPEKWEFWESADTMCLVASGTGITLKTSEIRPPGVSDSIELELDSGVTRQASERPKGPWRSIPDRRDSIREWATNIKGGAQTTPMRGMETGITAMV